MKKLLLIILLIVGHSQLLGAYQYYISPGIQIGVNSSTEYFFSYQATFGLYGGFGYSGSPGITLGRRHYKTGLKEWNSYKDIYRQVTPSYSI